MPQAPRTVDALCDRAEDWAFGYYRKPGSRRPTREHYNVRDALRALRETIPLKPPPEVVAEDLIAAQDWMVGQGLSRPTINARCNRIRRVFKWASKPPQRWVPPTVLTELSLVDPIQRGRTRAPDPEPITPATWEQVSSTLARADFELATAIELLWHTGMRPCELVRMLRSEIRELAPELMTYRPAEHKTDHYGIKREISIGPDGCRVLRPWLRRLPADQDKVFRWSRTNSLGQAITRINRGHGIEPWRPNQLRHAFATRIRAAGPNGLEIARILLGHKHASTTEIYAEANRAAAIEFMRRFG